MKFRHVTAALLGLLLTAATAEAGVITIEPGSQITLQPTEATTVQCDGSAATGRFYCSCDVGNSGGVNYYDLNLYSTSAAAAIHQLDVFDYNHDGYTQCTAALRQHPACRP